MEAKRAEIGEKKVHLRNYSVNGATEKETFNPFIFFTPSKPLMSS